MERGSERQRCQTLVNSNKRTDLGKMRKYLITFEEETARG